jgi:hypothetical protein
VHVTSDTCCQGVDNVCVRAYSASLPCFVMPLMCCRFRPASEVKDCFTNELNLLALPDNVTLKLRVPTFFLIESRDRKDIHNSPHT